MQSLSSQQATAVFSFKFTSNEFTQRFYTNRFSQIWLQYFKILLPPPVHPVPFFCWRLPPLKQNRTCVRTSPYWGLLSLLVTVQHCRYHQQQPFVKDAKQLKDHLLLGFLHRCSNIDTDMLDKYWCKPGLVFAWLQIPSDSTAHLLKSPTAPQHNACPVSWLPLQNIGLQCKIVTSLGWHKRQHGAGSPPAMDL